MSGQMIGCRAGLAAWMALELVGCGGGGGDSGTAEPLEKSAGVQLVEVVAKAAATRIPVYRFYNASTGAHFFTTSTTERDSVIASLSPPFSYEGPAFSVASAYSPGLSPVHRFFNTRTGVHFYTISEAERASIAGTLPHFAYEGVAYHASALAGPGLTPLYRFFLPARGFHFYTASSAEKDSIVASLGATYSYEGIAYYVLDSDWRAMKLPHTGITSSQCYEAGGDSLFACARSGTKALNPSQDGHRTGVNAMSYAEVPRASGGTYARSECVLDRVTGLTWYFPDPMSDQSWSGADNTSWVVDPTNAARHCGYADWRAPSRAELHTLVDYSRTSAPFINTSWFPNAVGERYATTDRPSASTMGFVTFGGSTGYAAVAAVTSGSSPVPFRLALVRGTAFSGSRFSYATVAYGPDAANNVVNDGWTGLQWRRCLEGWVWNGTACTGTASFLTHEQALAYARDKSGWRLPNVRELSSLQNATGDLIDGAFSFATQPSVSTVWTSTPSAAFPDRAWAMVFGAARGYTYYQRSTPYPVRLVREP